MDDYTSLVQFVIQFFSGAEEYLSEQTYNYLISSLLIFAASLMISGTISAMFGALSALTGLRRGGKQ